MSAKVLAAGCVPAGAPARFLTASSSRLGGRADITLLLPPVELVRRPVSLMIVMHGLFGSHWNWLALGGLGDLAHDMWRQGVLPPLVIALPSDGLRGDGTGYLPTHDGDYESWILEDVPAAVADDTRLTDPSAPILLAGNSMGGRISIEVGLRYPERVKSLALLCPAVAFIKRDYHPIVRLLRPEFGVLPHRFTRGMVAAQFWSLFRDRDAVDPSVADIACDEFQRIYGSAGARFAFLSSARNIYLDKPFGRGGFYPRLSELSAPSLFVWGTHDPLIPQAFKRHVERWLPRADQVVLDNCGHVPQIERADHLAEICRPGVVVVPVPGLV